MGGEKMDAENPFGSNPRVLVVDDEIEIAKMLAVMLQMNRYDAVAHSDPAEALESVKERAPEYMITDVVMPGMNGVELAMAVKQAAPGCKVLLFSGQIGAPELLKKAAEEGHEFLLLEKPIHPLKLVEAMESL
jgi:DNA-binding NtrC family response regulator